MAGGVQLMTGVGERLLASLHKRRLVTWERRSEDAPVLMVTNAWPRSERRAHGVFLVDTVDALAERGLASDVLFIRGYRGPHTYLLGCLALALLARASGRSYALVNSHGGEAALVARCYFGVPVIASYWGSDILGPAAGGRRHRIKATLVSRLLRFHSRWMTATTTKSREMEQLLPAAVQRRNWVIPDGVDRTRFVPADRTQARRDLGWPQDEITVISVGTRLALKRLALAEQAVILAAEQLSALRWRSIADVDPARMPLHYQAADCLIHTSMSEGSPNAVKEALACDLPVVATRAGDIPELLAGVQPSAVCTADPPALAREILRCAQAGRSNGRQRTQHLGRGPIADRVFACYQSLGLPVSRADSGPAGAG